MAVAMLILPAGDAISKALMSFAGPFEVTLWRSVANGMLFGPVAILARRRLGGPPVSGAAAFSGLLLITISFLLISAFQRMPIATAIAIFFVEPLLLTLLAGPFLGEVPGPRRLVAVGVGLIGALIVIRPNFQIFGPVALMPALAALAYAANMIVLRRASMRQSALSLQIGATLTAALLAALAALTAALSGRGGPSYFLAPVWVQLAVPAAAILFAAAFLLITFAFSRCEASTLAPLQYLEIVGATLVGLIFFGSLPDAWTWIGTAIILGSGLYILHRDRRA
ncbi:DMT family transporter [Paracoccus sp. (in: a-proteobacteria)]